MKLRQPRQLLELMKTMLREPQKGSLTHKTYIAQLVPLVQCLSQSDMQNVFAYMRDWNTSPKNCACAQALLGAILATYSPKVLVPCIGCLCHRPVTHRFHSTTVQRAHYLVTNISSVQDIAAVQGLQEISEALLLYTGRHYDRMDRMLESTYLLDYLLSRIYLYKLPAGATQR